MSVLVSVIIPSYNSEKYIEETIQSVLKQSEQDVEIIVVDDGSPDKQADVIKRIAKIDSRVKYIYQDNQGVCSARNHGYQLSRGKFIAFLDSDDVWLPNNLEVKIEKFSQGSFGLVHSDAVVINEHSEIQKEVLSGNEGDLIDEMLAWESTQIPGPSSILVKRKVYETIGGFDINLSTAADQDFFLRIASKYKIGRVPAVTWQYRIHDQNMHSNIAVMEKDVLYVYNKALKNNFFKSISFENKCFANMYLILAASWAGDGKNKIKGLQFGLKAIRRNPKIIKKLVNKFARNFK